MRTLSIRQPWAWLIVQGYKDIENRTWQTYYRGPIYVHAGRTFDHEGYAWVKQRFPDIDLPTISSFARGVIVGEVRVVGMLRSSTSPWFSGPWGWQLADARALALPIPCKGSLGLFSAHIRDPQVIQEDPYAQTAHP